jgi:gluconokinase
VSTASSSDPHIVSLDIGSSSIRAFLFDIGARQMEGFGATLPYQIHATSDGGAEANPEELAGMALDCLDEVHRQARQAGMKIAAVTGSAFWHGLMGTGQDGKPTVPVLHLFDTRSAPYVARTPEAHERTGCPRHSSYWPSKLLWLREARPAEFAATTRWMSLAEYLSEKLFGRLHASISMTSATGLWNPRTNDYDAPSLEAAGIARDQLATPSDQPERELTLRFRRLWPQFERAQWFPILGDGALNNAGSGCVSAKSFGLMVGTTGALRAMVDAVPESIPAALWCYRLDASRAVMGGALSNGGEVYSWCKRTLALPKDIEARLEQATPGDHGLSLLPFFSGERTPYWRGDLRAAITGMTFATEPMDIFRAAMESVAVGFRQTYDLLSAALGEPNEIVASGGGLLRSPGWTQMMADALGRPVTASTELEASARGAVLWALEQMRMIPSLGSLAASNGAIFEPRAQQQAAFEELMTRRQELYRKLYGTD